MNLKGIKDMFNPYTPMTLKAFWNQQLIIFLWAFLVGIPGVILEKNGAGLGVILFICLLFVGGSTYLEFIFIVKRYRDKNIPPIWASFVFVLPLNVVAFIIAATDDNDKVNIYGKKLLGLLQEIDNV